MNGVDGQISPPQTFFEMTGEYSADTGPRAQKKGIALHKSRERLLSRVIVVEGEELPLLSLGTGISICWQWNPPFNQLARCLRW